MITSYNEYLEKPLSLTLGMMEEVHKEILKGIEGDADALELYEDLIQKATQYAGIRAQWLLMDRITKIENDDSRTSCHNSLIVKFDVLARYLKNKGKDTVWRDILGYEKTNRVNRKRIGDFACYLVFVNSLNAR